jgi:hypothetical protein
MISQKYERGNKEAKKQSDIQISTNLKASKCAQITNGF